MARISIAGRLNGRKVEATWTDESGLDGDDELVARAEALERAGVDVALPGYAGGPAVTADAGAGATVAATLLRALDDVDRVELELDTGAGAPADAVY